GMAVVDIDADSSLDVLTSGYISNDVRFYKNEGGSPISWRRYFIDDDFYGAEFLHAGDIDGDGDPDVVVTSARGNSVAWYENNMPDTNWSKHLIDDGTLPGAITCDIGDLDSDGDLDVAVTGSQANRLVWYKNNLPDTNWIKKLIDGSLPVAFGVSIGDIDGDDTMDVAATSSFNDYVVWYNTTDFGENWNKYIIYPDYFSGARLLDIVDMDLDGDNDVLATAFDAGVVVCFQNRLPDIWARHNIDLNLPSANYICSADIFEDGIPEVLATGRSPSNTLRMYDAILNVELLSEILPTDYKLMQNYPNPFNPSTKIKYSLPQSSNVVIKAFDILGNEIETLVNEEKPTGTYETTWYADGFPSGIYFYQLRSGNFVETKKMVLLR
ncbi:MAG: T9SS type A sorting domain-containing protein, partial [Ignavibacteria bacterium]|nr:T9SS type A sorting domain-containing protein [Ignavibacteria bacterium]